MASAQVDAPQVEEVTSHPEVEPVNIPPPKKPEIEETEKEDEEEEEELGNLGVINIPDDEKEDEHLEEEDEWMAPQMVDEGGPAKKVPEFSDEDEEEDDD